MKRLLTACMVVISSTIACGVDNEQSSTEGNLQADELGQMESRLWTGWTSDGLPPLECEPGRLVNGAECSGSYCDNIRLDCTPASATYGFSYWTTAFSEEATNSRLCGSGEWVTGLSCSGSYCDNVSLECTQITNRAVGACYWSRWITDGSSPFWAPSGYYVRGAQCYGRYCDDMRFYYCQLY
jgi:hypothetical protein